MANKGNIVYEFELIRKADGKKQIQTGRGNSLEEAQADINDRYGRNGNYTISPVSTTPIGQRVETKTMTEGSRANTYSIVPLSEPSGQRIVDKRSAEDIANEKAYSEVYKASGVKRNEGESIEQYTKRVQGTSAKSTGIDYTFRVGQETAEQYAERIAQARGESTTTSPSKGSGQTGSTGGSSGGASSKANYDQLFSLPEFQSLSTDEQDALKAVFGAIVENDAEAAGKLESAFRAATKLADPYFAQKIRIAADAIQRGYVSIEDEGAFKEEQLRNALTDLRTDLNNKREYLTFQEQNELRDIERQYGQELETTRQNLAASGFTSSSRRAQKEELLQETKDGMVESTNRKFGYERTADENNLLRGERDTASEIERLRQLTEEGKIDLLRKGEEQLGSKGISDLGLNYTPLGGIYGTIPEERQLDIINSVKDFVF